MGSPTSGAWTCRHGVDGRDFCPECFKPSSKPRIFALGPKRQEIALEWLIRREGAEVLEFRDHALEVAPGVWVAVLGWGSFMLPDGTLSSGAKVAVWCDE